MTNYNESRITNSNLLYPELSYQIQGSIFNVSNKYGKGLKESIYQKALAEELEKAELQYEQQKRINIYSLDSGKILGTYVPDFVVENKIIIEIKASAFTTRQDVRQQQSYLKASIYEVAYLVNFCTPQLFIKRSIYTNDRKPFIVKIRAS
ncbi:GxxExxY protein [Patescibacteria group bacterium]|nr:GxxExxY protein [Patescibacteria group bacterium]